MFATARKIARPKFASDLMRAVRGDHVFTGAAALAFYLTLALFPALVALMNLIPYMPIQHVDQAIMDLLAESLPADAFGLVKRVLGEALREQHAGLLSFGTVAALWSASTGMYAIMQQLNITCDVEEGRSFVRARATAAGLTLLFGVLILGSFSLIVAGGKVQDWMGAQFGFPFGLLALFAAIRWVIIVFALLVGFAIIYLYGPNELQSVASVVPGSLFSVVLTIIASLNFSFYTSRLANYTALYGSIGAVVILMLWLYIAGLVMLVGAELNMLLKRSVSDP